MENCIGFLPLAVLWKAYFMLMTHLEIGNMVHFPLFLVGSLVVNYPFDDDEQGVATYSKSPDDAVFQQIALSYSKVSLCLNITSYTTNSII